MPKIDCYSANCRFYSGGYCTNQIVKEEFKNITVAKEIRIESKCQCYKFAPKK